MSDKVLTDRLDALVAEVQALKDAAQPPVFNSGDTAWLLTSTAIVLLMTLPGLSLFYGGMSQAKNVLSCLMQTMSLSCMISLLWIMMGYSLCFGTGSPVFGGAERFWFIGTKEVTDQKSASRLGPTSFHPLAPTIPETVFITYQLTFAIITAAIVCGSFAERMKFWPMLIFMFFWHFLVYCPVAHSEWATDGFLALAGDLDFAGGNVVHVCSGFSGLAAAIIIGPRKGYGVEDLVPHNLVYTVIGGSLLWVGWFGFNAGSAVSAGSQAGFAMLVTHLCAATGGFVWILLEKLTTGKAGTFGIVSGCVTGLVLITPGSGYVDQTGAVMMGLIGTPIVFFGLKLKKMAGYDDAMDAFGVHGVGGMIGGILTGFFANDFISGNPEKKGVFYGKGVQLGIQIYAIVVVAGWSFFMSSIILMILHKTIGIRVSEEHEDAGLDISEHGEVGVRAEDMYAKQPMPYGPNGTVWGNTNPAVGNNWPPMQQAPWPMHMQHAFPNPGVPVTSGPTLSGSLDTAPQPMAHPRNTNMIAPPLLYTQQ